jgi:hypothetical protein
MDELTPEEVVFTTTHHVSIIWATLMQYMPSYFFKIHLRPRLPSRFFSSGFRAEVLYEFLFYLTRTTCPTHTILLHRVTRKYSVNSTNHEAPHFDLMFHLVYRIYIRLFVVVTDRLCCCVRLVVHYKSNIHVPPTPKVLLVTVKSVQYSSSTFCRNNSARVQEIRDTMEVPPLVAYNHCFLSNSIVPKLQLMLLFLLSHFYWLYTLAYTLTCSYLQPTHRTFLFTGNILFFFHIYILVSSSCSCI